MTLERELAAAAPRLTERVLGEMYANPFWRERFGDRGRLHAGKDGDFHVRYLCESLAAGDHGVFINYARWLRELLVARGMCSRHLAENFERLAQAIDDEPWPDRARAVATLHTGAHSLTYVDGEPGALDQSRGELATRAAGADLSRDELDIHLSYLADAVAAAEPTRFASYLQFLGGWFARCDRPVAHLHASLRRLGEAIAERHVLPTVATYLETARTALPAEAT